MKVKFLIRILGFFIGIIIFSFIFGELLLDEKKPELIYYLLIHFAGYLFFLVMPVETIFLYYLSLGYNPVLLIVFAILTAIFAQLIDFLIGLVFAQKVREKYFTSRQYEKIRFRLGKHSQIIIFLFNLSPFSSPLIVLVAGILRIRIDYVLIYSFLGLLVKYLLLVEIYYLF